jgi:HSP20 family molecular chaperone IbpA
MSFFAVENPFKKAGARCRQGFGPNGAGRCGELNTVASKNTWVPPVDILETDSAYVFKADVPGMKAGDIHVTRVQEMLVISGERNVGTRPHLLRQERSHGYFCRRLPLPANASREEIKARLSEGVLQITLRKFLAGNLEKDYPVRREISVNA